MASSVTNIGVIGCGRISGHHCNSIHAIDGVELLAVCDLISDKAEKYSREFNVPWFKDYRRMLEEYPEINTVVVATPSGMHFEHGIEIISHYKKNIILEKPIFLRPDHVEIAYDKAEELGLKLFPVFQNRYNKAVERVKKAIVNDELGDMRIMSVRVRWCRPQRYYDLAPWRGTFSHDGGALTNQGVHHVDLLRYLGGNIDKVSSTMRTLGASIEVEDTVVATFTYENGAVGVLEVTTSARPDDYEASISFVGSKGLAQIGGIAVNELQIFTPAPESCNVYSENFSSGIGIYGNGHKKMYKDIVSSLMQDQPFPVGREDCLNTVKLLNSFYRSDEKSVWVKVDTPELSTRLGRPNEEISKLYRN
jgi:predicted dehydrogenase